MKAFILRNLETGWQGGVTERRYNELIQKKNYIDPRLNAEEPAVEAEPSAVTEEVSTVHSGMWELLKKPGNWYDVIRGEEKANDKSLRRAAAETLCEELNSAL